MFCFYWAYCPMYESLCSIPTIIEGSLGLPIIVGIWDLGASYEANPDFVNPVPKSITIADNYYEFILFFCLKWYFIKF